MRPHPYLVTWLQIADYKADLWKVGFLLSKTLMLVELKVVHRVLTHIERQ